MQNNGFYAIEIHRRYRYKRNSWQEHCRYTDASNCSCLWTNLLIQVILATNQVKCVVNQDKISIHRCWFNIQFLYFLYFKTANKLYFVTSAGKGKKFFQDPVTFWCWWRWWRHVWRISWWYFCCFTTTGKRTKVHIDIESIDCFCLTVNYHGNRHLKDHALVLVIKRIHNGNSLLAV